MNPTAEFGSVSAASTPLQAELKNPGSSSRQKIRIAFERACERFARGESVDMQGIAEDVGVNRVTLYRWVGSREQLLTEVLWSATNDSFQRHRSDKIAGPRTPKALSTYVYDVTAHPGMRRLLDEEGELALHLLTSTSGTFQQRYIKLVRELLARDVSQGSLSIDLPLDDLAYTAVRITEAYVHTRVITGQDPDAKRAERVLCTMFR
ncbi:QsdR family transcriptional regulator [Rhodococcus qingshengii]|uniref:QsdR family transcriptional regulator n=1 Tax=Rhodococcus qingshengii TaxID=334542 RepID=UPI0037C91CCF